MENSIKGKDPKKSKRILYFLLVGQLFAGSGNVIIMKYWNETDVRIPGTEPPQFEKWAHPYFCALLTSLGQTLCLLFYYIKTRYI